MFWCLGAEFMMGGVVEVGSAVRFGETDVRNAWMHVDWGVAGEHPMEAMWGRRQCRRWRIREEGSDVIVKRALRDGWRMCG